MTASGTSSDPVLALLGAYSIVQDHIDDVVGELLEKRLPELGRLVRTRTRWSDPERLKALEAAVADCDPTFPIIDVLAAVREAKPLRDAIGHGYGSHRDDAFYTFQKRGARQTFSVAELEAVVADLFWVGHNLTVLKVRQKSPTVRVRRKTEGGWEEVDASTMPWIARGALPHAPGTAKEPPARPL